MNLFTLKTPRLLNVDVKGLRGLVSSARNFKVPHQVIAPGSAAVDKGFVSLKPGEETEIAVSVSKLKANANVRVLKAVLHAEPYTPRQDENLKLSQTAVVNKDGNESTFNVRVDMPLLPRNVIMKLEGGDIFWTFPGDMVEKEYELPDFSAHVNAYLDKLAPGTGGVSLKFLVRSDSRGKVKIEIDEDHIEYSLIQTETWENVMDETVRFDRNFELDYGTIERLELGAIDGSGYAGVSITGIGMDIGGDFGPARLLGSVPIHGGGEFATIDNDYSAAQKIILETPVQCCGISGFFQVDSEAEVYIEIQNDIRGVPGEEPPLTGINLALTPGSGNGTGGRQWRFFGFEVPVDLTAGTPYWVVIKGIQGSVRLGLAAPQDDYLQQVLVNRGGQLWREIGPAGAPGAGQLRLVYIPGIDNQTAAVEIGAEAAGVLEKFDPGPGEQAISLDIPGTPGSGRVTLLIKSHARGTLGIANVIREYSPG
jgi:hypothetical protein